MATLTANPAPTAQGTPSRSMAWRVSMGALAVTLLCLVSIPTQADPDLWGHIRCGLDVIEAHALPRFDQYSFTASGAPLFDHEWFGEVVFAFAWKIAGSAGLVALKIGIVLLTGFLCFYHLIRSGVRSDLAAAVLLLLIPLLPPFLLVRPLQLTIPAFAFTLMVLSRANSGNYRELWILPPLYALWANLHGGFLAGLALFCIWAGCKAIEHRRLSLTVILALASTFLATWLNPHGWHLVPFLIQTAAVPRPEIVEWEALRATSEFGLMYVVVLGISVISLVVSRREKPWPLLVLFGVASLLPFVAVRHTTLAIVAAVVLAGPHVADLLLRSARKPSATFPAWAPIMPAACALLLAVVIVRQPLRISVSPKNFPVDAVRLLRASGIEGNLIHQFNWGEYLMWHVGPRLKVMIDGRRESVYPEETYQRYLDFQGGTGDWDRIFRGYPADVALLERDTVAANLMLLKPGWTKVYDDGIAIILVRPGTPTGDRMTQAAASCSRPSGPFYFP